MVRYAQEWQKEEMSGPIEISIPSIPSIPMLISLSDRYFVSSLSSVYVAMESKTSQCFSGHFISDDTLLSPILSAFGILKVSVSVLV